MENLIWVILYNPHEAPDYHLPRLLFGICAHEIKYVLFEDIRYDYGKLSNITMAWHRYTCSFRFMLYNFFDIHTDVTLFIDEDPDIDIFILCDSILPRVCKLQRIDFNTIAAPVQIEKQNIHPRFSEIMINYFSDKLKIDN